MVVDEALDLTLTLEVADGDTGERAVDLHTVNERRLRDHLEGGHLLEDAVVGGLVEDDHVLGLLVVDCSEEAGGMSVNRVQQHVAKREWRPETYLVLNLALGPFLLLGRLGRSGGDGSFLGGHLVIIENNGWKSQRLVLG